MHERREVPEYVPGPTCLANTLCQVTRIYIPTWRLVRERILDHNFNKKKRYIGWVTYITRFKKIAIQRTPQKAVDKEAISLSRVYSYYSKRILP